MSQLAAVNGAGQLIVLQSVTLQLQGFSATLMSPPAAAAVMTETATMMIG